MSLKIRIVLITIISLFVIGCSSESAEIEITDFQLEDNNGKTVSLYQTLSENDSVILVFFRGHFWGICRAQLVELQEVYPEIQSLNSELFALSMDDIYDTTTLSLALDLDYSVLSDPDAYVTKKYGVFNLLGDGVATPSVFIIDDNKTVVWSYIGDNISDRAELKDILSNIPAN